MQGGDQVSEAYDTPHDIGVLRIAKMPDGHRRFWRRDQKQIVPLEFAPTDRITVVAQFHKINRTFVFARPHTSNDFVLLRIDLHEGAWANDGIKRVIIRPNIAIEDLLRAGLLEQEKGHLAQAQEHAVHEIRLLEWELERQLRRRAGTRI